MDSQRSFLENQTLVDIDNNDWRYFLQNQAQEYGNGANPNLLRQIQLFDFEEYVEEALSNSAKICEDQLEVEKAKATEKFFREAYDNLLNMQCSPPDINSEDAQQLREATHKFLENSYNNLIHMFDGVSETGKGDYLL
ncbi:Uncharacterized protein TCM_036465 [Theobroma cacao]|uniref:Uncharacterized protein n=1 Tax=Theobroma cacao TaxID=3641 RepID=A0A061FKV5_THECC|nr:Uncharacterized protein TCM_036465 [Theobroma cacao]